MRLPSTSSSSLFPSWLTTMSVGSLFVSILGLSMFSMVLLDTRNVNMLTLLELSQSLPNPLDFFKVITSIYRKCSSWIPSINPPVLNATGNGANILNALNYLIGAILNIFKGILYILSAIPAFIITIVLTPVYVLAWAFNTIGIIISAINGTTWYVLDLSWINNFINSL